MEIKSFLYGYKIINSFIKKLLNKIFIKKLWFIYLVFCWGDKIIEVVLVFVGSLGYDICSVCFLFIMVFIVCLLVVILSSVIFIGVVLLFIIEFLFWLFGVWVDLLLFLDKVFWIFLLIFVR